MKRIVLIYGSIAGAIVIAMFIVTVPLYKSAVLNWDYGEIIGYTTMAIAMSMIFFGVKSYRDTYQHGVITFGRGFQVGLLIAIVATLLYAIGWEFYFNLFYPDFMTDYADLCVTKARQQGASAVEIDELSAKLEQTIEMYKNPILRFLITMMEIFPVGLVIALISAAILHKKEILPA